MDSKTLKAKPQRKLAKKQNWIKCYMYVCALKQQALGTIALHHTYKVESKGSLKYTLFLYKSFFLDPFLSKVGMFMKNFYGIAESQCFTAFRRSVHIQLKSIIAQ